jgi:heme-degrading monooxygenase HmoA
METPYYAVIFTSEMSDYTHGYENMAEEMVILAQNQPGYLGIESARSDIGITVSYWKDLESIKDWKQHADHLAAQQKGRSDWYKNYKVRIARVEREYGFES